MHPHQFGYMESETPTGVRRRRVASSTTSHQQAWPTTTTRARAAYCDERELLLLVGRSVARASPHHIISTRAENICTVTWIWIIINTRELALCSSRCSFSLALDLLFFVMLCSGGCCPPWGVVVWSARARWFIEKSCFLVRCSFTFFPWSGRTRAADLGRRSFGGSARSQLQEVAAHTDWHTHAHAAQSSAIIEGLFCTGIRFGSSEGPPEKWPQLGLKQCDENGRVAELLMRIVSYFLPVLRARWLFLTKKGHFFFCSSFCFVSFFHSKFIREAWSQQAEQSLQLWWWLVRQEYQQQHQQHSSALPDCGKQEDGGTSLLRPARVRVCGARLAHEGSKARMNEWMSEV